VYLGLESGSPDTLRRMNKQSTLAAGVQAVEQFRAAGIETAAFFIVGYPGDTPADVEATFKFALSLPLDDMSFNVPFPLPGSGLFERVKGIDPAGDWRVENDLTFIYSSEFDPDWLRRGVARTLEEFHRRRKSTRRPAQSGVESLSAGRHPQPEIISSKREPDR
jgi:anaerobic magnesium-protoporphyrin IX monomethyl ester cyclase